MIEAGELGPLRRVIWLATGLFRSHAYYASGGWRATWAGEGGGVLINQGSHDLDLLQWFAGLPQRVTAKLGLGRHHPIEVEDDVSALLEYPGGATGLFAITTGEAPGTNRVEIAGDRGKLELDTESRKLSFLRNAMSASEFSRTTTERFERPGFTEVDAARRVDARVARATSSFWRTSATPSSRACRSSRRRRRRSDRWRSGTRCSCRGSSGRTVELPIDAALMEREMNRLAASVAPPAASVRSDRARRARTATSAPGSGTVIEAQVAQESLEEVVDAEADGERATVAHVVVAARERARRRHRHAVHVEPQDLPRPARPPRGATRRGRRGPTSPPFPASMAHTRPEGRVPAKSWPW